MDRQHTTQSNKSMKTTSTTYTWSEQPPIWIPRSISSSSDSSPSLSDGSTIDFGSLLDLALTQPRAMSNGSIEETSPIRNTSRSIQSSQSIENYRELWKLLDTKPKIDASPLVQEDQLKAGGEPSPVHLQPQNLTNPISEVTGGTYWDY